MKELIEQILAKNPAKDQILLGIKEVHDKAAKQARIWLEHKDKLQPVFATLEHLGARIVVNSDGDIHVAIAGDKECFIACWKLWRALGVRLDPPGPGATQITQLIYPLNLSIFFFFTSTVCKRVKVGTRMVPQDIYETQCGEDLASISQKVLETEVSEVPSLIESDDIPF